MLFDGVQGSKPWRFTGKEENMERDDIKLLVKMWWDIYEDETLDYWNCVSLERFKEALSEAGSIIAGTAPSAA